MACCVRRGRLNHYGVTAKHGRAARSPPARRRAPSRAPPAACPRRSRPRARPRGRPRERAAARGRATVETETRLRDAISVRAASSSRDPSSHLRARRAGTDGHGESGQEDTQLSLLMYGDDALSDISRWMARLRACFPPRARRARRGAPPRPRRARRAAARARPRPPRSARVVARAPPRPSRASPGAAARVSIVMMPVHPIPFHSSPFQYITGQYISVYFSVSKLYSV